MNGTMKIRDVAASDYEQWLPLWNGYNAFYGRSGPTALPVEVTATTWQSFFDAREPVYALVAELDGSLIGLTHYLFHRSTTLLAPIFYLQDLYTAPERRRTGVGRALIEAVYECARDAGSPRVYWQTHETNLVAQRLTEQAPEPSGLIGYRRNLT